MRKEIGIVDLLVEFLQHWRGIVLGMLAGAVLLGTFSYMDSYQAFQGTAGIEGLGYEEAGVQLKSKLSAGQVGRVEEAVRYAQIYATAKNYADRSILMQLDFDHVEKTEMIFYVTGNDRHTDSAVKAIYEALIQSEEANRYIMDRIETDDTDIGEIISLNQESLSASNEASSFMVSILHYSAEDCAAIAQALTGFVEEKHNELEKIIGKHDVTLISQYSATIVDMEILNRQNARLSEVSAWDRTAASVRSNFAANEEMDYYNYLLRGADNYVGSAEKPKISKVQVVLGMSIGAFVYIMILLGKYLLNTRLCAADQLQELYGIPQFGTIMPPEKKKRFFNFIDQRIRRFRDRSRRQYTDEETLELTAAAVKVAAEQEEVQDIYLVSCGLSETSLAVCEKIKEVLVRENIQVKIVNHVLSDVQAMNALESGKGAVLAEEAAVAFYSEISSEIDLLEKKNIKVLGGIVLE